MRFRLIPVSCRGAYISTTSINVECRDIFQSQAISSKVFRMKQQQQQLVSISMVSKICGKLLYEILRIQSTTCFICYMTMTNTNRLKHNLIILMLTYDLKILSTEI